MDEYKSLLEHVDKLVDRRQAVTNIYITVNAAIVGATSLVIINAPDLKWQHQVAVLLLMVAGTIACDLWRRLIVQYSTLIGWWFGQLRNIESKLPDSSRLLNMEYDELYTKHKGHIQIGLTRYEIRLTWLITGIYIIFGVSTITLLSA